MAQTKISWTATVTPDGEWLQGYTFNPWIGCTHYHPGCAHCYAEEFANRFGKAKWGKAGTRAMTSASNWANPVKWNREAEKSGIRRKVFCASLADVFEDWDGQVVDHKGAKLWMHEGTNCELRAGEDDGWMEVNGWAPLKLDHLRRALFRMIDATPWLDWLLLTKRPENVRRMWPGHRLRTFRKNVWIGTSVSDQKTADSAVPELRKCRDLTPVLFLSAEPLLGPVDLRLASAIDGQKDSMIDWVIVGGESGSHARPCRVDWVRSLRDQCQAAEVPCFIKQLGSVPIGHDGENAILGKGELDSKQVVDPAWLGSFCQMNLVMSLAQIVGAMRKDPYVPHPRVMNTIIEAANDIVAAVKKFDKQKETDAVNEKLIAESPDEWKAKPLQERVFLWSQSLNLGVSSAYAGALLSEAFEVRFRPDADTMDMFEIRRQFPPPRPSDPDDFSRLLKLFDYVPEFRERALHPVKTPLGVSKAWRTLLVNFEKWEAYYRQDRREELYELMQVMRADDDTDRKERKGTRRAIKAT